MLSNSLSFSILVISFFFKSSDRQIVLSLFSLAFTIAKFLAEQFNMNDERTHAFDREKPQWKGVHMHTKENIKP
jgi:hypothetical protein